jgi:hypothetical protein
MNSFVEKTVIELGYESVDIFFHEKLIEGVQQKIDKYTKEVIEFTIRNFRSSRKSICKKKAKKSLRRMTMEWSGNGILEPFKS